MSAQELAQQTRAVLAQVAPEVDGSEDELSRLDRQRRQALAARSFTITPDGQGSILLKGQLPAGQTPRPPANPSTSAGSNASSPPASAEPWQPATAHARSPAATNHRPNAKPTPSPPGGQAEPPPSRTWCFSAPTTPGWSNPSASGKAPVRHHAGPSAWMRMATPNSSHQHAAPTNPRAGPKRLCRKDDRSPWRPGHTFRAGHTFPNANAPVLLEECGRVRVAVVLRPSAGPRDRRSGPSGPAWG